MCSRGADSSCTSEHDTSAVDGRISLVLVSMIQVQ